MNVEIIALLFIVLFVLSANGQVDGKKFFKDSNVIFKKLKEEDYDFLVRAKYGPDVDPDVLFAKRIENAFLIMTVLLLLFISKFSYIYLLIDCIVAFYTYKSQYSSLKSYRRRHLHEIDIMLPYYLKNLEILVQHYTVPVALGKSINDAPPIFRDGLEELINQINSGDSTIEPYMNFARNYPVRDSMRMMRLLYRLSLGSQDRKQEQLLTFSRSISSLQQKARETKYKARLDKMESKTMIMLVGTGGGVMVLLVIAILQTFSM